MFSDKEKKKMTINYNGCEITHFKLDHRKLPKGSTKGEFGRWLHDTVQKLDIKK